MDTGTLVFAPRGSLGIGIVVEVDRDFAQVRFKSDGNGPPRKFRMSDLVVSDIQEDADLSELVARPAKKKAAAKRKASK